MTKWVTLFYMGLLVAGLSAKDRDAGNGRDVWEVIKEDRQKVPKLDRRPGKCDCDCIKEF